VFRRLNQHFVRPSGDSTGDSTGKSNWFIQVFQGIWAIICIPRILIEIGGIMWNNTYPSIFVAFFN
jgi:hypothetical protein